jgi:SAM-dependent methyltransferase
MTYLLFPGRHLLNTSFQEAYLRGLLQTPLDRLAFLEGPQPEMTTPIDQIIFAITSANHQHARYNPIPFYVRAIGVDRFARALELSHDIRYRIIGIPHYPPTPRFAGIVLKEIEQQTEADLVLTPANCVVLCSTPGLIEQYQALGFAVLGAENRAEPAPPTPIDVIKLLVDTGKDWQFEAGLRAQLSAATFDLWQDFPDVPRRVQRIWRDPLLTDDGGLTESRNYDVYLYRMANRDIMRLKYEDIKPGIKPGRIVDEGCADGALLALIARDYPDSDLIGIEIASELIARCLERQRAGDFGGTFVHFHQRNITEPIFEEDSIDTTLCNSTVHELWSYGDGAATVEAYFALKYAQTRPGGRLVIRDVVGPAQREEEVYLWLNHEDGHGKDIFAPFTDADALAVHLAGLSTFSRFLRFARDFLARQRAEGRRDPETAITYRLETIAGRRYAVLRRQDAAEFISKMTYVENWDSEMNEAFAFWEFAEWKAALARAGFRVLENPNEPASGSRAYLNPWLVENRFRGRVALYRLEADGALASLPYPDSNLVLVAEKPAVPAA